MTALAEDTKKHIGLSDLMKGKSEDRAAKLAAKRKELESLRASDVRDWALNRAFYRGNQWVIWNRFLGEVERLPMDDEMPRWKVRMTSNEIMPGVQHYIAQLTKTRPVVRATPDSSADRDVKAAQMADALYDHWWIDHALKSKLQSALALAQLSQGYWKITWDALAGKSMRVMVGPDGRPIPDTELSDAYREELQQLATANGLDPNEVLSQFEQTAYVGDIRIEVVPGENVLLDPIASCFEEANYAICVHAMDPDEVKARWGADVSPDSTPEDSIPLLLQKRDGRKSDMTRRVFIGYFRPCPALPEGRYIVWIEDPHQILVDEPWPYPFDELPLVKFPGVERPDSATDEALVTHIRPLQKELNRTLSQMMEHKNLTLKPQMMAPHGSLRQRLTDEPGAVWEYNIVPLGGQAAMPSWREMPNLPNYAFEILGNIQARIDAKFNRMPSQRDQLPARSDSGYQVELIQEAVADQISPTIQRMEDALCRAGTIMVQLAQAYYEEPRLVKIKGVGGSVQAKKFMAADLQGGFSFQAEPASGLPRSRAGRVQQIKEMLEMQLIDPRTAMKQLDLANFNGIQAELAADEDHAYREHEKLIKGVPLNQIAMHSAMRAVNAGMNPETGQPLQSPEEAEMVMERASIMPVPHENPAAHLEVHDRLMKSVEFETYPPDIQHRFHMHRMFTAEMLSANTPVDPATLPKVNVTAKATTSASVLGEILRKHGIQVSDEQVAEEPLETAVYDSIDKPDADSAGNDPFTPLEQLLTMQRAEEEHVRKTAKAAHELALSEESAQRANNDGAASDARTEELHEQKLRHNEQTQGEKVKQMRKPKPAAKKS